MVLGRDDVWAGYERMVVEIDCCEQPIVVRPDPSGRAGEWPWPGVHPVHILTAWDPGKSRPGLAMNRRCQARLEAELRPQAVNLWSARGGDPATGVRDEGVAVRGLDEEAVRALGARYGQDAIFSWSPAEWAIVACLGTRRVATGWALGPIARDVPSQRGRGTP
jgi:hypothetical protein